MIFRWGWLQEFFWEFFEELVLYNITRILLRVSPEIYPAVVVEFFHGNSFINSSENVCRSYSWLFRESFRSLFRHMFNFSRNFSLHTSNESFVGILDDSFGRIHVAVFKGIPMKPFKKWINCRKNLHGNF